MAKRYYTKVGIEHFAYGLIIPISIIWKLNNGLNLFEAAITESAILVTTAILAIPTGLFADTHGNKRSMIIGGIFQSIAIALLAIGGSFGIFMISALCSGVGWAFLTGADEAYIHDDYLEDKKLYQRVFANASIADEAATLLGMLAGSLLLFLQTGMRSVFIASTLFSFASVVYLYVFLPRNRDGASRPSDKATLLRTISAKTVKKEASRLFAIFLAFAMLFESGRLLWQPQLAHVGINAAKFGLLFALFQIASIAGSYFARHEQAFTTKRLAALFTLMIVTLVTFGSRSPYLSVAALTGFLLCENYFRVYMSSTLNRLIVSNRAALLSIGEMTRNITSGGLVVALGFVGKQSIFLALLIFAAVKVPAAFYALTRQKQDVGEHQMLTS